MHKVCPLSDLEPGDAIRVETTPPIAVFHTEEGKLYALDDTCTHQDASLADGWLEADGRRIYEANDLRVALFRA